MNHYTFEELTVGKQASFETTVQPEDISAFVGISGDSSPIHVDDPFAQARGFESRLAHGALLASYVSRLIGVYLPGANGLLQTLEMQFRQPCYAGMTVRVEGEITRQIESVRAVRIKITITDVNSGVVLSSATVQSGILDQPHGLPVASTQTTK